MRGGFSVHDDIEEGPFQKAELRADGGIDQSGPEQPRTEKKVRNCPNCPDRHEVEVVTEPGWERMVYCPRTGVMG